MAACTFFGHRDCPDSIRPKLCAVLADCIENHHVDTFYIGRQGNFDALARSVLRELEAIYPHIRCAVVLETLDGASAPDAFETVFPAGLENVPPRFAIDRRNHWMLRQAEVVVVYVAHTFGGAAKFAAKAERQGKTVINLAD